MKHSITCFCFASLSALFIIAVLGCGGSDGLKVEYVEGTVTLDGQPVAEASVMFVPTSESPTIETAMGITDTRGVYKLSSMNGRPQAGAVEGEYKILVSKIEAQSHSTGVEYGASFGYAVPYTQTHLLPGVYRDPENTPFTATVKRGRNTGVNFELQSSP